jgi:hypothetical protein
MPKIKQQIMKTFHNYKLSHSQVPNTLILLTKRYRIKEPKMGAKVTHCQVGVGN